MAIETSFLKINDYEELEIVDDKARKEINSINNCTLSNEDVIITLLEQGYKAEGLGTIELTISSVDYNKEFLYIRFKSIGKTLIDWGDGSREFFISEDKDNSNHISHNYLEQGIFVITIIQLNGEIIPAGENIEDPQGMVYYYRCLKKVYLSDEIKTIGDSAFGSSSIESITIPDSVTNIKNCAFAYTDLEKITLSKNITVLPYECFYSCCDLTKIIIPNSVRFIDDYCFAHCNSLSEVYMESNIPPTLGTNVFLYTSDNLKIYVPQGTLNAYQTAPNWEQYASKIHEEE